MKKLVNFLRNSGKTQTDFAKKIGITSQQLTDIIKKRKKMTPELAIKIEKETKGLVKKEYLIFYEYFDESAENYMEDEVQQFYDDNSKHPLFKEMSRMGKEIGKINNKLHKNHEFMQEQYNNLMSHLISKEEVLNKVEEK